MLKKKGELLDLPFILIFALILGAFILLFGFNVIENLVSYGQSVEISKFVTDFREDVEKYYYFEPGSSKEIKINLPKDVQFVCFKKSSPNERINLLNQKWVFMIENDLQNNLFFFPPFKRSAINVPHLGDPSLKTYCTKNGDTIKIKSQGTYVGVE